VRAHAVFIRRVLWPGALLAWLTFAVTAAGFHRAWDLDATLTAIPLTAGTAAALLYTGTRWRPAPRPAHARHPGITLRQFLWAGFFIAPFLIAVAAADPVRLRVLDYCGTVLLLTCPGGLTLRWWFGRRERQPVDRKVYELAQNVAWTRQDVTRLHRLLADMLSYVKGDLSDGADEHARRRHLRPVRTVSSDDTGPQRAVLGGAALVTEALL